ncbi:MAG: hypothetical protein WBG97_06125 [Pseudomonas sp.]
MKKHAYEVSVSWVGNRGEGTSSYTAYSRDFAVEMPGKPTLAGSADPAFRGDSQRWNPEDMLVASLSACHKLWYHKELAMRLHEEAHHECFIANSVNFPVTCEATITSVS